MRLFFGILLTFFVVSLFSILIFVYNNGQLSVLKKYCSYKNMTFNIIDGQYTCTFEKVIEQIDWYK